MWDSAQAVPKAFRNGGNHLASIQASSCPQGTRAGAEACARGAMTEGVFIPLNG